MEMPQPISIARSLQYQHRPLTGDEIRLIKLQPGRFADDLFAEIVHRRLESAPEKPEQSLLSTVEVDKTLPQGWRSFRTPEGELLYRDTEDDSPCRYYHPSPNLLPKELREALQEDSARVSQTDITERGMQLEALSYAWGDPAPQDILHITDAGVAKETSLLPLTSNLSSALRHLRDDLQLRFLWVDAICINQDDYAERNAQVLRIADIFRSAWRVIVWLGESSHDSGLAIKTLQYFGKQIEISREIFTHRPPDSREPQWSNRDFKLPYKDAEWTSLSSLLERPWFSRLWVTQEIALANPIAVLQCGYDTMLYYYFRRAIVGLHQRGGAPKSLLNQVDGKVDLSYGPRNLTMWSLIFLGRMRRCSVAHDKIYALLGFFGPKLRSCILPSYEKPLVQTFKEVFLAHSNSTGRLELLAHCSLDERFDGPSWVPDWRAWGPGYRHVPEATTQAAGLSSSRFKERSAGELEITGVLPGGVSSLFEVLESEQSEDVSLWLRKLLKEYEQSATYPTGESSKETFAKLMCSNEINERFPDIGLFYTEAKWQDILDVVMTRNDPKHADELYVDGFLRRQLAMWKGRRVSELRMHI